MKGTIVYYGGFALPDKSASANRVVSNGKLFSSLGYETVFLGSDYENRFDGVKKLSENMYLETHPVSSKDWLNSIVSFSNLKDFVSRYQGVKMVILYNVPCITLYLAKKYFAQKGISVAYDCTEWTQFTEGSFLKKAFKFVDEFFIRKFAHKVADKMIVISNLMEKKYISHKKLLKLPPLVDVTDEIWHQPIEKDEKCFTFCFAGFPDGNKDSLDKVVEAFQLLDTQRFKLNVVGVTDGDFAKLYPNTKVSDKSNISFLGKQTHRDTIKYVLNSDCYIFIRMSDRRNNAGFPTKFAESFTCGVPIITTDVSDIKDYIADSSDSIVLHDTETTNIYNAMIKVFENNNSKNIKTLKTNFYYTEYKQKTKQWLE